MTLKAYEEHGIIIRETKDDEAICDCIFCDKEKHLYINTETALFSCKRCGQEGGLFTFLKLRYLQYLEDTTDTQLELLGRYRKIKPFYLKEFGICYDSQEKRYILPYYNFDGQICSLKTYRIGQKPITTSGTHPTLFGLGADGNRREAGDGLYICEGEFDTVSLAACLDQAGIRGTVLGLSGAGTFKQNWSHIAHDRETFICTDNDGPGLEGAAKIRSLIKSETRSIWIVNWPKEFQQGFDVSDLLGPIVYDNEDAVTGYKILKSYLQPYHPSDPPAIKQQNKVILGEYSGPRPTFDEIVDTFSKTIDLYPRYVDAIKIALATIVSLQVNRDSPVWTFLVGPPGTGKTTLLEAFEFSPRCKFESVITPTALISGFRSGKNDTDCSILAVIDGRCLVIKDFTEVINLPMQLKDQTNGILRGAFDGFVNRQYGSNVRRDYRCHFSILAGVTKAIFKENSADLGERFLKFFIQDDFGNHRGDIQLKAANASLFGGKSKDELKEVMKRFLWQPFKVTPEFLNRRPQWFIDKLIALCDVITHVRTPVARFDRGHLQHRFVYKPTPEAGTRLTVVLQKLAMSIALVQGKDQIDEEIYTLVKQVALDSVYGYTFDIVNFLSQNNRKVPKREIASAINVDIFSVEAYLQELEQLKVIEKHISTTKVGDKTQSLSEFNLRSDIKRLMEISTL